MYLVDFVDDFAEQLPMLEEIDFKLSELSNENSSCNDAIRESISTVKKNIDEILRWAPQDKYIMII